MWIDDQEHEGSCLTPKAGLTVATEMAKGVSRTLPVGSAGYRYAENILQLHTPQSRRAFVRIDAVHALQNETLLSKFEDDSRGMHVRDSWFYPYPGDDVDAVTKTGFSALEGSPMRFGLYFLDGKLAGGRGPTLKMVLCKIAPGRSCVKPEEDVGGFFKAPAGYQSLYVPGASTSENPAIEDGTAAMADQAASSDPTAPSTTSVFNDCYVLFNGDFAIPTHVVSYHLEVDEGAMADKASETPHQTDRALCTGNVSLGEQLSRAQCRREKKTVHCSTHSGP